MHNLTPQYRMNGEYPPGEGPQTDLEKEYYAFTKWLIRSQRWLAPDAVGMYPEEKRFVVHVPTRYTTRIHLAPSSWTLNGGNTYRVDFTVSKS